MTTELCIYTIREFNICDIPAYLFKTSLLFIGMIIVVFGIIFGTGYIVTYFKYR